MTSDVHTRSRAVIERLRDGNRRFVEGAASRFAREELEHRRRLAAGQSPDAVILTCADSRVPPTLVFDQGLGNLFVLRVAGNVVTPEQLGSVEFAVDSLGTRVVVVLGHTGCGAVTAAVDLLGDDAPELSPNLRSIVDRIRPAAQAAAVEVLGEGTTLEALSEERRAEVVDRAVRLNVAGAVNDLRAGSSLLDGLAEAGELTILGAEYDLESGRVELLD